MASPAPLPSPAIEKFTAQFREEAAERLAELEATLLELEESPADVELIGRAFRAMHTIKGSGAMFGFDDIAAFTHQLETVFDNVRNGKLAITPALIGLSLRSKDVIRAMLDGAGATVAAEREALVQGLKAFSSNDTAAPAAAAPASAPLPAAPAEAPAPAGGQTFRVRFRPPKDLLQDGTTPLPLLDELRGLGRCEVVGHRDAVPALAELEPEACYLWWDAILTTDKGEDAIRDVFIFVEGRGELRIEKIDDGASGEAAYKKLGEILLERRDLTALQLHEALAAQKNIGDMLVSRGALPPDAVQAAVVEQQVVREARQKREGARPSDEASSIRVPAEKLDLLVDLVGELVIAQARLGAIAVSREDTEISAVAEVLERLSASLRDSTLNIRMVPIGTTFSRFKRLVRDLSSELGKEIELVTDGAETELDKTVIDRLGDPLVHLIRNSCDHGIETAEERARAGKPVRSTVKLSAYQSGPSVVVEIKDDGKGLDSAAIRAKALQRGLIEADARLSETELFNLIFLPGFSTAKSVSNLSGRGVGLDVVKRSIDALRGSVELESKPGQGVTVRLKLPLTLAIIEGLLVAVGDARYVLPMSLVEECVELTAEDVENSHGNQLAAVRGELVPYVRLRDWFGVEGARPPIEQIAIAHAGGQRFGVVIDHVIGQHQTVIKTLGSVYRDVKGLSGATILGNGAVALIIDLPTVMQSAVS
jgi:two-component system chemotaxis sensor kinase CheA